MAIQIIQRNEDLTFLYGVSLTLEVDLDECFIRIRNFRPYGMTDLDLDIFDTEFGGEIDIDVEEGATRHFKDEDGNCGFELEVIVTVQKQFRYFGLGPTWAPTITRIPLQILSPDCCKDDDEED